MVKHGFSKHAGVNSPSCICRIFTRTRSTCSPTASPATQIQKDRKISCGLWSSLAWPVSSMQEWVRRSHTITDIWGTHLSFPIIFGLLYVCWAADERLIVEVIYVLLQYVLNWTVLTLYNLKSAHTHCRLEWLLPVFFHPTLSQHCRLSQFTSEIVCLLVSSILITWECSTSCGVHSGEFTMSNLWSFQILPHKLNFHDSV